MNSIDGKTRVLGLIGNPVEHTMSPFIQNMLAEHMGINSIYVPFYVGNNLLEAAIEGAKALNIIGNNVTVPYKSEVLPYIDVISESASMIGAVNTLKYVNGQCFGYNTDAEGLRRLCTKNNIQLEDKIVCILGAGGAAKAVAIVCAQMKVRKMIIVNRTVEKALELQKTVRKYFDLDIDVRAYEEIKSIEKLDICFQTTSIGMHPNSDDSPISDAAFFDQIEWAVDCIYNPIETKFLKEARSHGVKTVNGLGMLFYQAIKAFEIWHDLIVPEHIVEASFQEFYDFVYKK